MKSDDQRDGAGLELSWMEVVPDLTDEMVAALPSPDADRAASYTHLSARDHFVAARWLLRSVLAGHDTAFGVELAFETHGKPFVAGAPPFNVSHSNGVVVCAVLARAGAGELEVGVDVEAPWRGSNVEAISGRFFAESERDALARMSGEARRDAFFELWTLKEALLKGTGKGLTRPLSSVVFDRLDGRWRRATELESAWTMWQGRLPTGHIVSAAVSAEHARFGEPTEITPVL